MISVQERILGPIAPGRGAGPGRHVARDAGLGRFQHRRELDPRWGAHRYRLLQFLRHHHGERAARCHMELGLAASAEAHLRNAYDGSKQCRGFMDMTRERSIVGRRWRRTPGIPDAQCSQRSVIPAA